MGCGVTGSKVQAGATGSTTDDSVWVKVTIKVILVLVMTFEEVPPEDEKDGQTSDATDDAANNRACVRGRAAAADACGAVARTRRTNDDGDLLS